MAALVASSIDPVMFNPRRFWYSAIAADVPLPNLPSAPPTSPIESLIKTVCIAFTVSLRSPSFGKFDVTTAAGAAATVLTEATTTTFGALNMPRATAVASSTTFVTVKPFAA